MGGGGFSRPVARGSRVYVLCAEPKEHKRSRPGTRPGRIGFPAGRIGDRGDRDIVYVPNVYVPFLAPNSWLRVFFQYVKVQDYRHPVYRLEVVFGIVRAILYRLSPENSYLGNSAGADCDFPLS